MGESADADSGDVEDDEYDHDCDNTVSDCDVEMLAVDEWSDVVVAAAAAAPVAADDGYYCNKRFSVEKTTNGGCPSHYVFVNSNEFQRRIDRLLHLWRSPSDWDTEAYSPVVG